MQFKRMLLTCSALITLAYSFPTGMQEITTTLPHSEIILLDAKENKRPLVVIMEEKNPKSDSVVVQFVYTSNGGNSIVQSTGSEKDKYFIDYPVHKEKEVKLNSKWLQNLNTSKAVHSETTEQKPNSSKSEVMAAVSLTPQEESPLSGKWPKYVYDAFNPVQPFPELQTGKANQIHKEKIIKQNDDTYLPYYDKERKDTPYVAGLQLNPLSIYDREYNVPIFD